MAERLYPGNPYGEPEGFWRRLRWWLRQDYKLAERWKHEQEIRADERRKIAVAAREEDADAQA